MFRDEEQSTVAVAVLSDVELAVCENIRVLKKLEPASGVTGQDDTLVTHLDGTHFQHRHAGTIFLPDPVVKLPITQALLMFAYRERKTTASVIR